MRTAPLCLTALVALAGCRGGAIHDGVATLRPLRTGDRWEYQVFPDTQQTSLKVEVAAASPPAANGVRGLTLRFTKRHWGGLPGYPKGWQEATGSYRADQAADGTVLWGGSTDGMPAVDWILAAFPQRIPSPLAAGPITDTGVQRDDHGARRTVSRVVGEEIVPFGGRQRAWKVETIEEVWDRDDKLKVRTTTDDWYDGNHFLIRRRMHHEMPGNKLFAAADALGLGDREIVQKSPH